MTQPPNQGQYAPPMQGQSEPAQGHYGSPNQSQWGPPPKKHHTGRYVVLAILGIFILIAVVSVVVVGGSSNETTAKKTMDNADTGRADSDTKSSTNHTADATISSCTKDPTSGLPVAEVKVTNTSSKPSNYIVAVSFNRGSQQIDTGIVAINNLNPGSSRTQEASSLRMDVPAGFTCKIEDTTRLSAVG